MEQTLQYLQQNWLEIFSLVTGLIFLILEIRQKNAMWVIGILTGAACAFSFAVQHVWASMGLNIYYLAVSVIGRTASICTASRK